MPEIQPAAQSTNVTELAKAIVTAVSETAPKRKVSVADLKRRSVFNKEGKSKKERRLDRQMYQNGAPLLPSRLNNEEISLLNQLKPGKFINDLIEVKQLDNGKVHIFYNNKREHFLTLKTEVRNFVELLRRCVSEANELELEKATRPSRRRTGDDD